MRRWALVLSNLLTALVVLALGSVAIGAAPTLVTIIQGGLALSASNGLPVNIVAGGSGGGAVTMASGAVASGAYSSGSIASGAVASGAVASGAYAAGSIGSGAVASGAYASGALAAGAISDGADVTQGAKADAKSTATDTTPVTAMSVLKEISSLEQAPASRAVTNAGTFATQAAPAVATTGGVTTTYVVEPAASDNHVVIKNGAGQVYFVSAFNNSATVNYFRLYNAGTGFNGCNSATNLVYEGMIPASTSGAGVSIPLPMPLAFATGISICVTGAYGNTSTTNATASAISLNVGYN